MKEKEKRIETTDGMRGAGERRKGRRFMEIFLNYVFVYYLQRRGKK